MYNLAVWRSARRPSKLNSNLEFLLYNYSLLTHSAIWYTVLDLTIYVLTVMILLLLLLQEALRQSESTCLYYPLYPATAGVVMVVVALNHTAILLPSLKWCLYSEYGYILHCTITGGLPVKSSSQSLKYEICVFLSYRARRQVVYPAGLGLNSPAPEVLEKRYHSLFTSTICWLLHKLCSSTQHKIVVG